MSHTKQTHKSKLKKYTPAFTLVELIVVIVILSILATIAFLSFNNYSWATRDSNRLSDINSISKSIELYLVKTWVYPNPDNSFTITYSWWNVWHQWTIWDTLYRKISSNINKKPIDPLNNSEYIYSLLSYGNSYQIKSSYEWDSLSYDNTTENRKYRTENTTTKNWIYKIENNSNIFNPINKVQASTWNPKIAYIKWTYQWIVVKTTTWSTICILATPSIITNTWTVWNTYEIWSNILSWTLLYHWQSTSSWIYYNPNKPIYCSTSLPTNDTNSWLTNIASWIINAYSWTVVTTINPKIKDIVNTPISQLWSLWWSIVSWQLGGGVTSSSIIWVCGTANKTYSYSDSSFWSDIFCSVWVANPINPTFPLAGSSINRICNWINWWNNVSCTANRQPPPSVTCTWPWSTYVYYVYDKCSDWPWSYPWYECQPNWTWLSVWSRSSSWRRDINWRLRFRIYCYTVSNYYTSYWRATDDVYYDTTLSDCTVWRSTY